MRFYTNQHRYYCGIDLHARFQFVLVKDFWKHNVGLGQTA